MFKLIENNIYEVSNHQKKISYNSDKYDHHIIINNDDMIYLFDNNYQFQLSNKNIFYNHIIKGRIAFLFSYNKKIISELWISLNSNSNIKFEYWHDKINWQEEFTWGYAQTDKEHRNNSLYSANLSKMFDYCLNKGFQRSKFSVRKNNVYGNYSLVKFSPKLIGRGYNFLLFSRYSIRIKRYFKEKK